MNEIHTARGQEWRDLIASIRRRLDRRIAQQNHADAERSRRAAGLVLDSDRGELPGGTLEGASLMEWNPVTGRYD